MDKEKGLWSRIKLDRRFSFMRCVSHLKSSKERKGTYENNVFIFNLYVFMFRIIISYVQSTKLQKGSK